LFSSFCIATGVTGTPHDNATQTMPGTAPRLLLKENFDVA
jgi:hypothetical protein